MMKSPILKLVYVLSLWIATIACLDLGALAIWGYRPLEKFLAMVKLEMLFMPYLHYVVGVAGIIILLGLLMHKGGMGHCHCCD
jgi:hypothetical protein